MHPITQFFSTITQIKPSEFKAAIISFFFIFVLMASYMIMKPVRDALPSDWGDVSLARQWTYTFIVSTVAVSIYNFLASFISLRVLVPSVFVFFATTFLGIYTASQSDLIEITTLGKVFYVWSSVFSLFHISVFWSFISQHYSKEQSKRVFGFINTGASAGAIAGPALIWLLSQRINEENILLVTSVALILTLPLIFMLNRCFRESETEATQQNLKLSANPFSGFYEFIAHRRLLGIAAFIFLFTSISAFLYSTQKNLLAELPMADRTKWLGVVELCTNSLTIVIGMFVTNRLSRKFGMATTLSFVPFAVAVLILLLSLNPVVAYVLILQVVRRSGNYAITRPAREILFTAVDREARFKTKPIIDVAVYRGGDVFWIWVIALLGDGWLNLGLTPILWVGAMVAVIWGTVGVYLGKKHDSSEPDNESTQG